MPAYCACRLRGGLRRLDVRTADEYDDAEYSEAVEAVFASAERLARHCQTGGRWYAAPPSVSGLGGSTAERGCRHCCCRGMPPLLPGPWLPPALHPVLRLHSHTLLLSQAGPSPGACAPAWRSCCCSCCAIILLTCHSPPPCPAGWAFPWGLRARLAELLLRGMFDTLDEGQYTEQRQELLSALQVGGGLAG